VTIIIRKPVLSFQHGRTQILRKHLCLNTTGKICTFLHRRR